MQISVPYHQVSTPLPPVKIPKPPILHMPTATSPQFSVNAPNFLLQSTHMAPATIPLPPQLPRAIQLPTTQPSANAALNLDDDGQPLRYATAKAGKNSHLWQQAESEELARLLTTATIAPIHIHQQPTERRNDTTYCNPQTKEKETENGERTYRIRGTIGGDRINYPGPTTARTAAMPLVKLLLQSVISDNSK